jgi:ATP-dependent DNA ligase
VKRRGYEDSVAKGAARKYVGGRTRAWLKVKQKDWTAEEDRWQRRISAVPRRT